LATLTREGVSPARGGSGLRAAFVTRKGGGRGPWVGSFGAGGMQKRQKFLDIRPRTESKGNPVNIPEPEGWTEGCCRRIFGGGWARGLPGTAGGATPLRGPAGLGTGRCLREPAVLRGLQQAATLTDLWDASRDPGKRSLFLLTDFPTAAGVCSVWVRRREGGLPGPVPGGRPLGLPGSASPLELVVG